MPPASRKKARVEVAYEPPVKLDQYRSSLLLYVNGKRHEVKDALPTMSLLEWLRSIGLTGTKLGCGEGCASPRPRVHPKSHRPPAAQRLRRVHRDRDPLGRGARAGGPQRQRLPRPAL